MGRLLCNALAAVLLLSSSAAGWAESEKVGHPYVPEKGMTDTGRPHPISAYQVTRQLEVEGYKIDGPLKLTGRAWEAKTNKGTVRVDAFSDSISK